MIAMPDGSLFIQETHARLKLLKDLPTIQPARRDHDEQEEADVEEDSLSMMVIHRIGILLEEVFGSRTLSAIRIEPLDAGHNIADWISFAHDLFVDIVRFP